MENRLLDALRYLLFWGIPNADAVSNNNAVALGYIKDDKITNSGFKYIASKYKGTCAIPACTEVIKSRALCENHYKRYSKGHRGENLLYVKPHPSKYLMTLLEKVCRADGPGLDIRLMRENKMFMLLVQEGLELNLLRYHNKDVISITYEAFALLD